VVARTKTSQRWYSENVIGYYVKKKKKIIREGAGNVCRDKLIYDVENYVNSTTG